MRDRKAEKSYSGSVATLIRVTGELCDTASEFWGCEVGVSEGKTSRALLVAFPELRLIMVDAWSTYPPDHPYRLSGDHHAKLTAEEQHRHYRQALENTEFAKGRRSICRMDSLAASKSIMDGELAMAMIDADHTFGGVTRDLMAYWPKLGPGGVMFLHDVGHPRDKRGLWGVTRAAMEFSLNYQVGFHVEGDVGWMVKETGC